MSKVQERYTPRLMAANTSTTLTGPSVGGFISVTAGTLSITSVDSGNVLTAFPVAVGTYYPLPIYVGQNGGTVTLAGGASGTLLV